VSQRSRKAGLVVAFRADRPGGVVRGVFGESPRVTPLAVQVAEEAAMTSVSRIKATIRISPAQRRQRSGSTSKMCFNSSAQRGRIARSAGQSGVAPSAAGEIAARVRLSERIRARDQWSCLRKIPLSRSRNSIRAPPVEGRIEQGWVGLDVGDPVRVRLVHTDPERGFIDFARTGHVEAARRRR
jgi:RNase II-type exonuclease